MYRISNINFKYLLRQKYFIGLNQSTRDYKARKGCFGLLPQIEFPTSRQEDVKESENVFNNSNLVRLVNSYREHGYKISDINPLSTKKRQQNIVSFENFGFNKSGLDEEYILKGILNIPNYEKATLRDIVNFLHDTYCGNISVEVSHISDESEKDWFCHLFEESRVLEITNDQRMELATVLLKSQIFDNFLAKKFATVKRYGCEGAETMMAFFSELFRLSSAYGLQDVVLCMPHRGRLNLLTGILNYTPSQLFSKMAGNAEFSNEYKFLGDVLSHLVNSTDLYYGGKKLHVTMVPNPSHLEAVNPVAVGKARGKLLSRRSGHYRTSVDSHCEDEVLCMQNHGDAAFIAQGVVMETFCLANLPHFSVNGSVHLIVNNQLGFTTPSERGRSSPYASDVAKMIGCPVIRVNGECPEEVVKACRIAMAYRIKYKKDVVIDLVCYRRWGHNELDDPSFTQPSMYADITNRKSIPDLYIDQLIARGVATMEDFEKIESAENKYLSEELSASRDFEPKPTQFLGEWKGIVQANSDQVTVWDTGFNVEDLLYVGSKSVSIPDDFNVHPHLKKTFCEGRLAKLQQGSNIDWATAESFAIGSLLLEGYNVRISGQDVGRGTFSQRHVMLVDQKDDEIYIPLNQLTADQKGFLEVVNSPLSEEAVVGFEYGISIENPKNLVIWEAQFGDFFNGAQIMFDTFVFQGEVKWLLQNGMVILLPHGQDGAGPEHSSCRLERFLQLSDSKEDAVDSDDVNMEIVNPTTPAQYFHLLRRQIVRNYRKPLVVASPKVILRLPAAVSSLNEMAPGTCFHPVIGDTKTEPKQVEKVIFCSGKHYYALDKRRQAGGITNTALIRLEALTPFPAELLKEELIKYPNAKEFIWSQEEQRNMGAWTFVNPRFQNLLNVKLRYVGRPVLAIPAIGVVQWHHEETEKVLAETFQ